MEEKKQKNYPQRKRKQRITFRCTESEYEKISLRAAEAKLSLQNYMMQMCTQGQIIVRDYKTLTELTYELNKIGVNINQIAHRVNQNNTTHLADIKEIKKQQNEIYNLVRKYMRDNMV